MKIEWAAGLFEGEGSICVRMRRRGRIQIQVSLVSTDEDVIRRFARTVQSGAVHGPYKYTSNRKPYWTWSCHTWAEAIPFLKRIRPFLGRRRQDQIRVANAAWRERKQDARWIRS